MVLLSHGLLACAPTVSDAQSIIIALALADIVVIGDYDPDPQVREETRKLAERRAEELNGQLFFPPGEFKAMDEWIMKEKKAIDIIRDL